MVLRARPLLILPLFVFAYGYGTIDVADFYTLSTDPLALNPDAGRQFVQFSPLPFFLGYPITRALGPTVSFLAVMGAGLVFAIWALHRLVSRRYGRLENDAFVMFCTTPLLIVLTQYIGKSDAYVAGFTFLLPTIANPVGQMAIAALAVQSHFEMGLLILASAAILGIIPFRTAATGALIGIGLMLAYHYYLLPAPPQSRADIGMLLLREALEALAATPILHLIFTFGPFWLCVVAARPTDWRWLLMCGGTVLVACITIDFTRVFTLVGLPLMIAVVDRLVERLGADPDEARPPAWLATLPILALVQAHLIGQYVYDSRIPELVGRLFDQDFR